MKEEILNGLKNINIDYTSFEHHLEDDRRTSANYRFSFHTENYLVTLELAENVIWSSYDDYDFENYDVIDFIVEDENGNYYNDCLTDEEILKCYE